MPFKLTIIDKTDTSKTKEIVFDQEDITIGRNPSNHVVLHDDQRLISRNQARIFRREGKYYVMDTGGINAILLNTSTLTSGQFEPIQNGDQLKIGQYSIVFSMIESDPEPSIRLAGTPTTGRASEDVIPYFEEAEQIAKILDRINEKYTNESPLLRDELLRTALDEHLGKMRTCDTNLVVANALMAKQAATAGDTKEISVEQGTLNTPEQNRLVKALKLLIDAMEKMMNIQAWFQSEFMGRTMILSCTAEQLRQSLFDRETTDEQIDAYLRYFDRSAKEAVVHQIALLEGYKASVGEGGRELLDQVNPEVLEKNRTNDSSYVKRYLYRFLPLLREWNLMRSYRRTYRRASSEDRSVIEKKLFRPHFIRAYDNTIIEARKEHIHNTNKPVS